MLPVSGPCYRHFSPQSNRVHQEDSGRIRSKGKDCELIAKCDYTFP